MGYFRSIINILQTICKKCATVLLPEEDKNSFRIRLSNPALSYMTKKAVRKKIIEKCKKVNKCQYCGESNGFVKKMTGNKGMSTGNSVLKIVHERNRGRDKETVINDQLQEFQSAVEGNPDLQSALTSNIISQILTPIDVLKLFERIPESDIPLLAMDNKRLDRKE